MKVNDGNNFKKEIITFAIFVPMPMVDSVHFIKTY